MGPPWAHCMGKSYTNDCLVAKFTISIFPSLPLTSNTFALFRDDKGTIIHALDVPLTERRMLASKVQLPFSLSN